ncbi:MAG: tetratricopeptide repeat protein [Candidatus Nitrosocosmicus sp.]
MDNDHTISLSDNQDNADEIDKNKIGDSNLNNITIKNILNINKHYLDELDPKFRSSIEGFIKVLNGHLNDIPISSDLKQQLEKQIEGIVGEIKNIPFYKKVQNDLFTDSTNTTSEYNNKSIACYDTSPELDIQNADAYYKKGLSLSIIEKYTEAIECYDKAIEINPQNADAYYKKGLSLHYLGHHNKAIECYDKAIEINPPIRTSI